MDAVTTGEGRAVRLVVRGRVQGVGYRAWMAEKARRLGLAGWVRNRRDGSVEAVASGPGDAVDALVEACRHGPPLAAVSSIETFPCQDGGAGQGGFEQRSTA